VSVDSTGAVIVSSATTINLGSGSGSDHDSGGSAAAHPNQQASGVIIATQTLTAGGGSALTTDGAVYSAPSSGGTVVQSGGSRSTIYAGSDGMLTLGNGQTASQTAVSPTTASGVAIDEQTLTAADPALATNGVTYSALSSGGIVVQSDGSSSTVSAGYDGLLTLGDGQLASHVAVSPITTSGVAINGRTLTAGGSALIMGGATYSALPSGAGIQVISSGKTSTYGANPGGSAITLGNGQQATIVPVDSNPGFVTTVHGQTISEFSNGVIIDGITVTKGGSLLIIHGTAYSVNSDGQLMIAESSTLGGDEEFDSLTGAIETAASASGPGAPTSTPNPESAGTMDFAATSTSQTTQYTATPSAESAASTARHSMGAPCVCVLLGLFAFVL